MTKDRVRVTMERYYSKPMGNQILLQFSISQNTSQNIYRVHPRSINAMRVSFVDPSITNIGDFTRDLGRLWADA